MKKPYHWTLLYKHKQTIKHKNSTEEIFKVENISKRLKLILCSQLHLQIPP